MPQHVNAQQATSLRQVLFDVEDALEALELDDCDIGDLQEIVERALDELDRPSPNVRTLGTFLASLARSLRSQARVHTVVLELDAAIKDVRVPLN